MSKLFFTIFLLLGQYCVFSQEGDFISGQLLDANTGEPIVFASIHLKARKMGVISNLDGGFRIPTIYRSTGDILVISSMGYQRKELLVYDLAIYKMNLIRLEPAIFELTEAVVTASKPKRELKSATKIVRKAIKAIPQNYARRTFSTVGYYRDYQLEDEHYVNLNEAILEVFDPGFDQTDYGASKVRLYEYKPNNEFKRNKVSDRPYDYLKNTKTVPRAYIPSYGGNEFVILRVHDAIRNFNINSYDFINRLEIDFLENHIFRKMEDTYVDGEYLYTLKFTKRLPNYRMNGTLYISKRSFAIYKFEYAVRRILTGAAKRKRNVDSEVLFEVVNEYKPKYGKMYLNYISFHNIFQLAEPPEFNVKEVVADRRRRFFEVRLNKKVDPVFAVKRSNYKLKYLGDRIKFKNVAVLDDKVRLYPNLDAYEIDAMIALINDALENEETLKGLFDTEIKGLRTVNSDGEFIRLNERKLKNYHQFREFFVQEVKPNAIPVQDSLYMNKQRPIFKDQPFVKPDNFSDYWMNTPLKTIEN